MARTSQVLKVPELKIIFTIVTCYFYVIKVKETTVKINYYILNKLVDLRPIKFPTCSQANRIYLLNLVNLCSTDKTQIKSPTLCRW